MATNIEHYIGVMLPLVWRNIFTSSGWPVDFLGEKFELPSGDRVRAGRVKVSEENMKSVREKTGIVHNVINWGDRNEIRTKVAA